MWQRRYVLALAAGLDDKQAALAADVTRATISDWTTPGHRAYDPVFARADEMARHGAILAHSTETDDEVARWGPVLVPTMARRVLAEPDLRKASQGMAAIMGARTPVRDGGISITVQGSQIAVQVMQQARGLTPAESEAARQALEARYAAPKPD